MITIKSCLAFTIVLILLNSICSRRVKIAIYAHGYPNENPKSAYIFTNNVLYLNSIGADIVTVFPWDEHEYLDFVISNVDGFYFQGGDVDITSKSLYYKTYSYILNTLMDMNDRNVKKVAMFHTCLGFELFVNAVNGSDVLDNFKSEGEVVDLIFDEKDIKDSILYAGVTDDIIKAMREGKITNEYHKFGFTRKPFENPILKDYFKVTAYSLDQNQKEYVASVEAKKYPFLGVQYHPEKTSYQEYDVVSNSFEAIQFSKHLGFNFIDLARKSFENTIFEKDLSQTSFKTYCYLKLYKTTVIYDPQVFNIYFTMMLNNPEIKLQYSKYSLRFIKYNKFDYLTTPDGSKMITYTRNP